MPNYRLLITKNLKLQNSPIYYKKIFDSFFDKAFYLRSKRSKLKDHYQKKFTVQNYSANLLLSRFPVANNEFHNFPEHSLPFNFA